jgi:Protein of unknown function (DUF3667)
MTAAAPSEPARCPNCEAPLPEPAPKFCPHCGQETRVRAPALGEFLQQFGGAYLSTEGALWRTLRLLLLRPGELTVQYLRGRRKHYVLPLRLYLTLSVVVLLALRVASSEAIEEGRAIQVNTSTSQVMLISLGPNIQTGLKGGRFICEGFPAWVCRRMERRFQIEPAQMQREAAEMAKRLIGNLGVSMFVLLPFFAAALKVTYWNRRLRYTEHLVFALHVHAFWFLVFGLTLLPLPDFTDLLWLTIPVYTLWAMKRVYGGRWWPRLGRAALITLAYFGVLLIALVGLTLWAALT